MIIKFYQKISILIFIFIMILNTNCTPKKDINPLKMDVRNKVFFNEIDKFINDYKLNISKENEVLRLFILKNSCEGTKVVLTVGRKIKSMLYYYPIEGYFEYKGVIVLVYSGTTALFYDDNYCMSSEYRTLLNTHFPMDGFIKDWDEKSVNTLPVPTPYSPPVRGIVNSLDSLYYFTPTYWYPGLRCPKNYD